MKDTVFFPSFGNRPTRLVGREGLLREIESGLERPAGSRERATVLLGQRGSGKTALLWELFDFALGEGIVAASPTVVADGMLERMVEKLQDSGERYVKGRKARVSGGSIGALGFSAGLQFTREVQESKSAQYRLTQLVRRINEQGHGVMLLVDELQANSGDLRNLIITYQELVGEDLDVSVVMAGLPGAVSATLNDKVLTFLNRAQKRTLEPLAASDVDAYYEQAFDSLGVRLTAEMRHAAVEATFGSPYMLQLVGHNIVERAEDSGSISRQRLDEALAYSREDFENDVCKTTLAALSDVDIEFLAAMAHDEGESSISDIAQRMGVTPDYAQKYRRRLIGGGIVESPRRGKVAFAVPYLAHYLSRNRGPW